MIKTPLLRPALTVTPKALTLTALATSRAYNAADPTSWPRSITGFVNGDFLDSSELTGAPTFMSTDTSWDPSTGKDPSPVGNYTITVSPGTLSYPNYTFDQAHCVSGMLTITPAPLTITANNVPMNYADGTTLSDTSGFTAAGLLPIDSLSVTLSTNATLSSTSNYNVGTWTITPSAADFLTGSSSNYAITYANAATGLTVTPKLLTITGLSATDMVYDGSTVDPTSPKLLAVFYQKLRR